MSLPEMLCAVQLKYATYSLGNLTSFASRLDICNLQRVSFMSNFTVLILEYIL